MNSSWVTKRHRYWESALTEAWKVLSLAFLLVIGPILIYVLSVGVITFIIMMFLFFLIGLFLLYKLAESINACGHIMRLTARRFEGLSYFDQQQYQAGDTINFKYADRQSYKSPQAPISVSLRYIREEATWWLEKNPIKVWDIKTGTSVYNLSKGIKLLLPSEPPKVEATGPPAQKAGYYWEVMIEDTADKFQQRWRLATV